MSERENVRVADVNWAHKWAVELSERPFLADTAASRSEGTVREPLTWGTSKAATCAMRYGIHLALLRRIEHDIRSEYAYVVSREGEALCVWCGRKGDDVYPIGIYGLCFGCQPGELMLGHDDPNGPDEADAIASPTRWQAGFVTKKSDTP